MINYTNLPSKPGCYIYLDSKGKIIYIGKAKNLKKRVSSYFTKNDHDPKTTAMIKRISSIDYIITSNEIEALILENSLIKKHKPRFNIDLKDSKRYAYLRITNEKFPRVVVARQKKGNVFGPFVSANERDSILTSLNKIFMLRTCKRMPKKPCLRHHINLCKAPCINKITEEQYNEKIKNISKILNGNINEALQNLENHMENLSKKMLFEKAIETRSQIQALNYLKEKQLMERSKKYDEDIINYIIHKDKVYLLVFNIYKGTLNNKQEFEFEYKKDFLSEFIVQFYSEHPIPKELILPEEIDPKISEFLSIKRNSKTIVKVPKKGEKKSLLELVKNNLEKLVFGETEKIKALQKALKLGQPPETIEIFDVSHLSGTSTTASMVQFRQGKPDKNNYRRFKIITVEGIDDYAAIAEAVKRRYKRLKKEEKDFPQLIIIDGGRGQLKAASSQIEELGLKIPTISIAKKDEEIFFPGSRFPLKLEKKDTALKFIQEMRDEAHRFAIKYNKLLRKKSSEKGFKEAKDSK